MVRATDSFRRDIRFLALAAIPLSDRVRLVYEKYAGQARSALGLPLKPMFSFLRRPYHVSTPTDAALLQRVIVDTRDCLELFGLLGQTGLTALDVGAHNGETAIAWSIFLDEPTVYSVEPDPVSSKNAERNIEGVAAALYPLGLSDQAGEAPFDTGRGSGGDATFALEGARSDFTAVQVARGDEVLGSVSPDLVKIDVEGYERHVLDGLPEALSRCRFLTIEMSLQRPKDHRFHEIAAMLAGHRLELIGAGQTHGYEDRPTAIDLHFRKAEAVASPAGQ